MHAESVAQGRSMVVELTVSHLRLSPRASLCSTKLSADVVSRCGHTGGHRLLRRRSVSDPNGGLGALAGGKRGRFSSLRSSNFLQRSAGGANVFVSCMPTLPTFAHLCPPLPTFAHHCPPLPTFAYLCPPLPTFAHLCPLSHRFQVGKEGTRPDEAAARDDSSQC